MAGTNRNNTPLVITASATGRTTYTSPTFQNQAYRGCRLYVDITVKSSASHKPGFKLQGSIPGTTKFLTLWASTPTSTATQTLKILMFPGASTAGKANSTAAAYTKVINDFLPPTWRFVSTSALSSQGSSKAGTRAAWSASIDFLE